jgi:hypothetical protein
MGPVCEFQLPTTLLSKLPGLLRCGAPALLMTIGGVKTRDGFRATVTIKMRVDNEAIRQVLGGGLVASY